MSPVVSHRPISLTLAVIWLCLGAISNVVVGAFVGFDAITVTAFDPATGVLSLLAAFLALVCATLRFVVAAGVYTLQSWGRPSGLALFGFFTALNGGLYAIDVGGAVLSTEFFAVAGVVNLCFFFAVLMQPGAFNPTRLGGPDGTATSSNPHR